MNDLLFFRRPSANGLLMSKSRTNAGAEARSGPLRRLVDGDQKFVLLSDGI